MCACACACVRIIIILYNVIVSIAPCNNLSNDDVNGSCHYDCSATAMEYLATEVSAVSYRWPQSCQRHKQFRARSAKRIIALSSQRAALTKGCLPSDAVTSDGRSLNPRHRSSRISLASSASEHLPVLQRQIK